MDTEFGHYHRRSLRLKGYDYRQAGAYFVTLVTAERLDRFGTLEGGTMRLGQAGQVAEGEWLRLEERFPGLVLDEFVIMPNHLHGILVLPDRAAPSQVVGARQEANPQIEGSFFAS